MSTYRLTATRRAPVSEPYKAYHGRNFRGISQLSRLSKKLLFDIEVAAQVFPFKVNNFVLDNLIDWDSAPDDPLFRLVFPARDMLTPQDFEAVADALMRDAPAAELRFTVARIRAQLNPHPAGQVESNIPQLGGEPLAGMQHKYRETVLFFPSQGQTCHAYCTFCFRWPQFVGPSLQRFAARETSKLLAYLKAHPEVTDVLFTGGDTLVM